MELFFVSAGFMTLELLLKGEQLYSVSGLAPVKDSSVFKSSYCINDKTVWNNKPGAISNLSTLRSLDTPLAGNKKTRAISKKELLSSNIKPSPWAMELKKQFHYYFSGKALDFEVKLDNRGTDFQQKVWKAMRQIPWGQVSTYSQLAQAIKKPKAFRTVGSSCAKNPFLIVVPCHRVLAKNNQLGGFALGLKIKKQLLKLEKN